MGIPKGYKFRPRNSKLDDEIPWIVEGVKVVDGKDVQFKCLVTACSDGYALTKVRQATLQPSGDKCKVTLRDVTVRKAK